VAFVDNKDEDHNGVMLLSFEVLEHFFDQRDRGLDRRGLAGLCGTFAGFCRGGLFELHIERAVQWFDFAIETLYVAVEQRPEVVDEPSDDAVRAQNGEPLGHAGDVATFALRGAPKVGGSGGQRDVVQRTQRHECIAVRGCDAVALLCVTDGV